jgi:capsular polysaccharide export protein
MGYTGRVVSGVLDTEASAAVWHAAAKVPAAAGGTRAFLFLQGPQGRFFHLLSQEIARRGHAVHRINLNGGDRYDWPDKAVDYRGTAAKWPMFLDAYLEDHGITDILLFGDCRPLHQAARGIAKLRGVAIHVFEEGYIRPDWVTLERDGVNGHSSLPRDPAWFVIEAARLPPVPDQPPITASFGRRAHDAYWYYHHVVTGRLRFPFYRPHRPGSIIVEGLGWVYKFAGRGLAARRTAAGLKRLEGRRYFLLPLQLDKDYQIRVHSPFGTMHNATEFVIKSFARTAPADALLVIKQHPLECTFASWSRFVRHHARRMGVEDRVLYIDGGDLNALAAGSHGVVTVNSTSGTFALSAGKPVIVLGSAIYDIAGITHQDGLDAFWRAPMPPDTGIYDAFKRVLLDRCLVRGGLASQSAIATLVESTMARLLPQDTPIRR